MRYIEKCPVGCGSKVEDSRIILPEGALQRCGHCGQFFSQCTEQVFDATMEEFNDPQGTWPAEDAASSLARNTKKVIGKISKQLRKNSSQIKLLDVGCSNGAFLYQAAKLGLVAEGVEPAEEAAKSARKSGLNVHHGFLEEVRLPGENYDVITLFEVIEHLREPIPLLKECHRLLKKDGLMVIRTGNIQSWTVLAMKGDWHYFDMNKHGGHISFYNPDSISILAQKAGFKVEVLNTHSVTFCERESAGYLQYRLLRICSELSNLAAKLTGNGQEMEVYLRK